MPSRADSKKYLMRGVSPRSCSHNNQTSGASRRFRHSLAGVTRSAAKRAAHGRLVPLRHVTRRPARVGKLSAKARTVIAAAVRSTITSRDRGRPVCESGGMCTASVPRNTVRWREIPKAYARRH
jgi:hypothetical protein